MRLINWFQFTLTKHGIWCTRDMSQENRDLSHRIVGFLFIRNIASLIPSFAAHQKGTLWCHIHFPDGQETPDYNEFIVHSKLSSELFTRKSEVPGTFFYDRCCKIFCIKIFYMKKGPTYIFLFVSILHMFS